MQGDNVVICKKNQKRGYYFERKRECMKARQKVLYSFYSLPFYIVFLEALCISRKLMVFRHLCAKCKICAVVSICL